MSLTCGKVSLKLRASVALRPEYALVADCAMISGCHGKSVYYTTARKDGELQQTVINRYSDTDYGAYTVIPASRNSSTKLTRLIVQCV